MLQATINLYEFHELKEDAKLFAINEHGNFLEAVGSDYEDENGKMQIDFSRPNDADIIESIEINEYYFFANGEMANVTKFVGNHPKSGTTELNFAGSIITL